MMYLLGEDAPPDFPHFVVCIPRAKISSWDAFGKLRFSNFPDNESFAFDFRPTVFDFKHRQFMGWDTLYGLCQYMKQRVVNGSWNGVEAIDVFFTAQPEGAPIGHQR